MTLDIARYIDHTALKPETVPDDIIRLCQEAAEHHFAAVCVNPCYVDLAAHCLQGTGIKVATVIGFPLGSTLTAVKVAEAGEALVRKANELDMVIQLGAAKAGQWQAVTEDIRQVVAAAGSDAIVKVIVETGLLTAEEKKYACQAVLDSGAHFIKTSTGFGPGGATAEDIALFRSIAGDAIGIKASGGIRTFAQAAAMIAAGATRIGASAGVSIVRDAAAAGSGQ